MVLGVVTLEDVIEELIQEPIFDESDITVRHLTDKNRSTSQLAHLSLPLAAKQEQVKVLKTPQQVEVVEDGASAAGLRRQTSRRRRASKPPRRLVALTGGAGGGAASATAAAPSGAEPRLPGQLRGVEAVTNGGGAGVGGGGGVGGGSGAAQDSPLPPLPGAGPGAGAAL